MVIGDFRFHDIVDRLVDRDRYPIAARGSDRYRELVADARRQLEAGGCVRFARFVRDSYHAELRAETEALAPSALFSSAEYTPYGTPPDESFPAGHPRRNTHRTTSGSVTRDLIPETTLIQKLYLSGAFQAFIADCLDSDVIYPFRDPMRGLIINAMAHDSTLGWHFDANEFVVSLMTKRAESGGAFEYCPDIRRPGDENYAAVRAVLEGDRSRVRVLDLEVGDIQIFKGRFALHRVAPTVGERHTAIFGYSREPGYIGSVESTLRVYGRVMQAHLDAANTRHRDGLAD